MTFSQSPAWVTEQERTRALECMTGAEVRAAQSRTRESCLRGTSISSMEDHSCLAAASVRAEIQEGREEEWQGVPDDEFNWSTGVGIRADEGCRGMR